MAYARGEHQVLSEVHAPTVEQEDCRRGLRERERLVKKRTAHTNRIKGLLKTQGIMNFNPRSTDALARPDALVTGDSRPLSPCLKREIAREIKNHQLSWWFLIWKQLPVLCLEASRKSRQPVLGWLTRWGEKTLKGYWRHPTVGLPAIVQEEPVAEVARGDRETLAPELERVTQLGLQKLEQIRESRPTVVTVTCCERKPLRQGLPSMRS